MLQMNFASESVISLQTFVLNLPGILKLIFEIPASARLIERISYIDKKKIKNESSRKTLEKLETNDYLLLDPFLPSF